ncbi:MAG: glutathione S-transferase family protein [Gammaproteobacteria bacterium]|nr:glutathione S-transferase family protein [Pseudomonadales bacterium]MCP5349178.1 glutathione S-transferase family protein [Pseudomonadales bacterium]
MILYYAPLSVAIASLIALEEAGVDYEACKVDFKTTEQRSADYLKINPKGRVPALVTEQGIITETPAILTYIAQIQPTANLAPIADPFAFAQLQAFNSYLCATVHVAHAHKLRGSRWVDDPAAIEAMQKKVPQTMQECFSLIEAELFQGPWAMGQQYTVADGYLFTVSEWLEGDGVDITRFPQVADHNHRMRQRPAVQRALQYRQSV